MVFSLVKGWRGQSWLGFSYWTLCFRPVGFEADGSEIKGMRVQCAQPNDLLEVHVLLRQSPVFVMEPNHDTLGRMSPAGAVLRAMYGQDRQGRLRVPATDFLRPLQLNAAEVQLKLRETDTLKTDEVFVSAEVD